MLLNKVKSNQIEGNNKRMESEGGRGERKGRGCGKEMGREGGEVRLKA